MHDNLKAYEGWRENIAERSDWYLEVNACHPFLPVASTIGAIAKTRVASHPVLGVYRFRSWVWKEDGAKVIGTQDEFLSTKLNEVFYTPAHCYYGAPSKDIGTVASQNYREWIIVPQDLEQFLVRETDWNIVLTGQEKTFNLWGEYWDFPFIVDHPKVLNLVGKTESMLDVLSLASQCHGMITTSNCLAIWSIISNKPTIVLMNSKLTEPIVPGHAYWKEWVEYPPPNCSMATTYLQKKQDAQAELTYRQIHRHQQ